MERSPRSTAVPRTGASMGQCHTLRSFVISLAIAIAITKSTASGFTIPRDLLTSDLETGESKTLEVRDGLKTLNNNETVFDSMTEDSNSTVIAINRTNNINQNNSDGKVTEKRPIVNETTDTQTKISENNKIEMPSDATTIISTDTVSSALDTIAPSTSPTTIAATNASSNKVPNKSETTSPDIPSSQATSTKTSAQILLTTKSTEYSTVTNKIEMTETTVAKDQNNTVDITTVATVNTNNSNYINYNETTVAKDQNNTVDITTVATVNTNNSNYINYNDTGKTENKTNDFSTPNQPEMTTNDLAHSAITTIDDYESKVTTQIAFTDQKADQTNSKEESTTAKTDSLLDASTTTSSESKVDETSENFTGEVYTIDLDVSKLPPWKKYTTIDRKRTSIEDTTTTTTEKYTTIDIKRTSVEDTTTTTTEKDMARAETTQTRISLENVFTNTPIPSLEKLRSDIINAQELTTRQLVTTMSTGIETIGVSNPETTTSTTKIATEIDTEPTKLEIVSKRAGYKDNRGTNPPKPEEATTTQLSTRVSTNYTDVDSAMYEIEPSEVGLAKNKNGSVYESQSQLAEDAIKEELLKEATLNDHEQNAQFLQQEKIGLTPEIFTVDTLSVRPIDQEKKKSSILYAVSPNYKPLKKIDVQPLKQFVRDPDDNSWRNESISSLGIVFKPKNASKSFTQVLKNKTETELGNMTDKDSKDDLPELRVRLEKIAEVRKSKKRINKFGDTVYSDYEESSENTYPPRQDTTTPMTPTIESTSNFGPRTQSSTTDFDLTVNAISKERFDLFKTDINSPFTTNSYKPKKFYNMAEYYDTTDEYDADYVNQHKIDLKKFTKPMKTKEFIATQPPELLRTPPPEQLRTQPMTEYQPERKATLQYFPPTLKVVEKVNVYDYDTSFNRKVNFYDSNTETPQNVLPVSFGTVSPIPTEKYESLNKVTMKPTYTPMYHTDNLDKNLYLTNRPRTTEPPPHDGTFNRASYVIKHYRDFISEAAEGSDDERGEEYAYTEPPMRGVTVDELAKVSPRDSYQNDDDYDYDTKFRKDIMNRFVDNFNQNSERFKVDFPVLYNSSVVHGPPQHGRAAASSAFMKRLYEVSGGDARPAGPEPRRPCEPQCERTLELSPAYELHYYVPDEEEKQPLEPRAASPPRRFRL